MKKIFNCLICGIAILLLTGCDGDNKIIGTYQSSNGSTLILKQNGKCKLEVITTLSYSGWYNDVVAYIRSQGGNVRNIKSCTSTNYCYYNETLRENATSCFYEFNEDHIILTHNIGGNTTNRYNFSEDFSRLTWQGHGKVYIKQ